MPMLFRRHTNTHSPSPFSTPKTKPKPEKQKKSYLKVIIVYWLDGIAEIGGDLKE